MLVPELVAQIKLLDSQYKFAFMVGDSSNLQLIETLRDTYGLPLTAAKKQGKLSHILSLNSDFMTRSVVIMPGNDEMIKQLRSLTWDSKKLKEGKHEEIASKHNDLNDALLYAHHHSRHMWYEQPITKAIKQPSNKQMYDGMTEKLMERNKPQGLFGHIDFGEPNAD